MSSSKPVTIRQAILSDAPAVARIWLQGIKASSGDAGPEEEEAIKVFSSRISTPLGKSAFWVATADEKVIGWQNLTDFGYTGISRFAQSSTYVEELWHSAGIGKILLAHAQEQAASLGIQVIVGWIRADNHASIGLVKSLGWERVGLLPKKSDLDPIEFAYWAYAVQGESQR